MPFPTKTWIRKAKLQPPVGKNWSIAFHLLDSGKMPTDTLMSRKATSLFVNLGRDLFSVQVQHRGERFHIWIGIETDWRRHYDPLRLPDPDLATFGRWVARAERKFGTQFRRDKIFVRSNVKGGRDAVVAWIQNGYSF